MLHWILLLSGTLLVGCGSQQTTAAPPMARGTAVAAVDSAMLLRDLSVLAADSMEGRRTGTPGHRRAQAFLLERYRELGLERVGASYRHEFSFSGASGRPVEAANLVAQVTGSRYPDRYIVVTAHYDHLGIRGGELYPGADDNASGTAALLGLAEHFQRHRPSHSMIFVATDAEEGSAHGGLRGAREFVREPPVPLEQILVNVNLDMISRNDRVELYAAGTYHYPLLRPYVERVAERAPLTLLMGHDRPDLPHRDDWTMLSDHGAFHEAGIPFLYFGVEDHEDYHRPTDRLENIQPGFYVRALRTILDSLQELDAGLEGERPTGISPRASIQLLERLRTSCLRCGAGALVEFRDARQRFARAPIVAPPLALEHSMTLQDERLRFVGQPQCCQCLAQQPLRLGDPPVTRGKCEPKDFHRLAPRGCGGFGITTCEVDTRVVRQKVREQRVGITQRFPRGQYRVPEHGIGFCVPALPAIDGTQMV